MKTDSIGSTRSMARTLALGAALVVGAAMHAPLLEAQSPQQRPSQEQQRMDPAQRIERQVTMLTERLQLTPDQTGQVRAILTREQEQMRAQMEQRGQQSGQNREAVMERMRALRERTDQQINAALTEQQRAAYQALREETGSQRGRRNDIRQPAAPRTPTR
jgi:Spy/CpxP family protein refolding chaperone